MPDAATPKNPRQPRASKNRFALSAWPPDAAPVRLRPIAWRAPPLCPSPKVTASPRKVALRAHKVTPSARKVTPVMLKVTHGRAR